MTLNRGESTHMPYDDIDPTDLVRMQAAVDFNRYDDGASQLQRSPFMQQVGLFGKAKPKPVVTPNLSRRTMGLNIPTQMPDQLPAVIDPLAKLPPGGPIAAQPSALSQSPMGPQTQAPAEPVNPLTALAKMPMSRRKFMEIPANAAVSRVGKQIMGPIASKAIPEVVPEIVPEVVRSVAPTISPTIPLIDKFFRESMLDSVVEQMNSDDWGAGSAYGFYDDVRHHLKDKVPAKDLEKLDKYSTYLSNSYEKIFEGAEPTKSHYNTVKKFGDLFGKYLDYVPMEDFLGGTEFTRTVDEPAYMKSMLEDFDFTEGQIDEYLQHFFGDNLKRYEGFGED